MLDKTVVLVGLMGAGKTTIGHRLAKKLKVPFVDIDQEIEKSEGCTVAEIFEKKGEAYFREQEREQVTKELKAVPHVMATGGGAYMDESTRALIKDYALSVWLKADLDVLLDRVARKKSRPLLNGENKEEVLRRLMKERYPIYEQADIVIENNKGRHNKIVKKIIEALNIEK